MHFKTQQADVAGEASAAVPEGGVTACHIYCAVRATKNLRQRKEPQENMQRGGIAG